MAAYPAIDHQAARERMVRAHLAGRGVRDVRVLDAFRAVPREAFVEPGCEEFAYEDAPLPIGEGQTISQPYIVAAMLEAAAIGTNDRVLEVGAGSGYAAALASRIAQEVFAIERHSSLAHTAQRRLEELSYDNVRLRAGDGTHGWPEAAPFDAIIVSAGGPQVPSALKEQLAVGGRLVIPVGANETQQSLRKITRESAQEYRDEDLGTVRFVPLVGAHGWAEDGSRAASDHRPGRARGKTPADMIRAAAEPLAALDAREFATPFDRFADKRVVLLGEASHGTSEFYGARAAITRRLIEHHGFNIVAVEADWPDAASIDRYVRHRPSGTGAAAFQRFPRWMWRNTEVQAFVDWLREHNAPLAAEQRAGFFGLDLYNMRGSIAAVLEYLQRVDPQAAKVARQRYACLTPWQKDPATYGHAVLTAGYEKCERDVIAQCRDLLARELEYAREDGASFLDAAQNARLIASAERYYRVMYYGGAESWNLRDTHMFETLQHLLDAGGPQARAVVWAHNSHIGDARHTEMGYARDELNIGQLCREKFATQCALIGFGTHTGTVAAASNWDADVEIMQVRPSRQDSYERLCHDAGGERFALERFLLDLRDDTPLRRTLLEARLERFIGVIYRPDTELMSHYASASLPQQFDAYVWFDETRAVTPLGHEHLPAGAVPDTYPFGV
jgi:protein-L-isoaspartate(D-aspartate) O-methyltransferase